MSITPDLRPDEFEITFTCPTGACLAQITYAFSNELKTMPGAIKDMKAQVNKRIISEHKDGRHTRKPDHAKA